METSLTDARPIIPCIAVRFDNRLLLLQRGAESKYPHMWCIPGGKMEPGETPEATALRELQEETGILVPDLDELGDFNSSARDGQSQKYRLRVFTREFPVTQRPHVLTESGFQGFGWFTLPEMVKMRVMEPAVEVAWRMGLSREF